MKVNGRPPKYSTEEDRRAARNRQASEAKARMKERRAALAKQEAVCCAYLCLDPPEVGMKHCARHAKNKSNVSKYPSTCTRCGKIAMPLSCLCGCCDEEDEDRVKVRKRANQAKRRIIQRGASCSAS